MFCAGHSTRWVGAMTVHNAHEPTPASRQLVQLHSTIGTPQASIARLLDIDEKTLRKHYRDELDLAKDQANATIGGALFNKAKNGDTAAMIFWMKTRAGWKETIRTEGPGPNGEHIITPTVIRIVAATNDRSDDSPSAEAG